MSFESQTVELTSDDTWKRLAELADEGDPLALQKFLEALPDSEVPRAISLLNAGQKSRLISALTPHEAADLVSQLSDAQAVDLIESVEPEHAAAILAELPSADQADLIGDLDQAEATTILGHMEPEQAANARTLIAYDDDVAGGLMVTELLQYRQNLTVAQIISDMRQRAYEYRDYDIQYAYVCDADDKLTGVLRLRDLLLADNDADASSQMIPNPVSVSDQTPLDELVELFGAHHFLGVPVVNDAGQLVGVVQQSAVADAWAARQDSDYMKSQGIVGGEEIRSMPLVVRSRRRLAWLSINIVLNMIAASVIAAFQDTISAVIALAVFLPIISDMSGCSGSQAVAVTLRKLNLGLIRPCDVWRVWMKEILVGLINGSVASAA